MNREQLEKYIEENYTCLKDNPWNNDPDYTVFRHSSNKKWFALFMNIPQRKLGIDNDGKINVVNVKCDNIVIGSMLREKGFYRAYHMNKLNWLTIALDGSADDDKIKMLIDMSFNATAKKVR